MNISHFIIISYLCQFTKLINLFSKDNTTGLCHFWQRPYFNFASQLRAFSECRLYSLATTIKQFVHFIYNIISVFCTACHICFQFWPLELSFFLILHMLENLLSTCDTKFYQWFFITLLCYISSAPKCESGRFRGQKVMHSCFINSSSNQTFVGEKIKRVGIWTKVLEMSKARYCLCCLLNCSSRSGRIKKAVQSERLEFFIAPWWPLYDKSGQFHIFFSTFNGGLVGNCFYPKDIWLEVLFLPVHLIAVSLLSRTALRTP